MTNLNLVLLLLEDLREHVVSRGQLLPGRVPLPERLVAFASERCAFRARGVALPSPLAQARPGVLKLLQEVFVRIAIAETPAPPPRRGRLRLRALPRQVALGSLVLPPDAQLIRSRRRLEVRPRRVDHGLGGLLGREGDEAEVAPREEQDLIDGTVVPEEAPQNGLDVVALRGRGEARGRTLLIHRSSYKPFLLRPANPIFAWFGLVRGLVVRHRR